MAAQGIDLDGEARLVDAMAPRRARILDAGCGTGRTSGALHARGHRVVGVDIDARLIEAAEHDHPGPSYVVADLAHLEPVAVGAPMDVAICAGNVMAFVAPGSEVDVLSGIRRVLMPEGFAVVGCQVARYPLAEFDEHAATAGFVVEQRFATWDVRPWRDDADFAVTVLRNPDD